MGFLHLSVVNGWLLDAGLDVRIEDGAGSNKTIAYIGAKNYDIGFANVSSMAMAREKSLEFIMLMVRQGDLGVLIPKDKNVKTLKDIERMGLGIGYTTASMEGTFMDTFLKLGGTHRNKVNSSTSSRRRRSAATSPARWTRSPARTTSSAASSRS